MRCSPSLGVIQAAVLLEMARVCRQNSAGRTQKTLGHDSSHLEAIEFFPLYLPDNPLQCVLDLRTSRAKEHHGKEVSISRCLPDTFHFSRVRRSRRVGAGPDKVPSAGRRPGCGSRPKNTTGVPREPPCQDKPRVKNAGGPSGFADNPSLELLAESLISLRNTVQKSTLSNQVSNSSEKRRPRIFQVAGRLLGRRLTVLRD
jgi:hypothetical protein